MSEPSVSDPIDLTMDPVDTMLYVINAANPSLPNGPFTKDNLKIGLPTKLTVSDPETDPNTSLVIRAIPGKGYRGSSHVTYNRIDIADYAKTTLDVLTVSMKAFTGDTVADIVDDLNNVLLLQIDPMHVDNLTDVVDIESGKVSVISNPNSLIFKGTLEIDVTSGTQYSLDTVVTDTYVQETFIPPVAA